MTGAGDHMALAACPWCGGEASLRSSTDGDVEWAHCKPCRISGPLKLTTAEAITAWNTRHESGVIGEMRERLLASTESMERTLAAMDRYNEANGTHIIGPSLLTLGKMIAANRAILAKLDESSSTEPGKPATVPA